jgi:hypothetical protein
VTPIVKYMQSRTAIEKHPRILADDLVFQFYYFDKSLKATQTTSPYYFRYGGFDDARAYAAAVRDGLFDYVVFDGWAAPRSIQMRGAVRPVLSLRYTQRLDQRVPQMGGRLEVYERIREPRFIDATSRTLPERPFIENSDLRLFREWYGRTGRAFGTLDFRFGNLTGISAYQQAFQEQFFDAAYLGSSTGEPTEEIMNLLRASIRANYVAISSIRDTLNGEQIAMFVPREPDAQLPRIEIISPNHWETVRTARIDSVLRGRVVNAPAGWRLRADVYTNKWYPQGEAFAPSADGTFSHTIYLGGPCEHFIRVRLFDETGKQRAVASSYGVLRANPDGSAPRCP